jgi:predicted O-linked N-acetylglucosamine transferase (SPINDLY family)
MPSTMQPQPRTADRARRQWQLGQAHAKHGRWGEAGQAFAQAAKLAPGDSVYALNLARALLKQGRVAEAGQEAARAFRLDPRSEIACALWVHCLMEQKRHAEAVQALRQLPPDVPRGYDYHEVLGRALQACGQPREAIKAYFDALAIRMDLAHVHYQVGVCFNEIGMKEEATECFKTALALGLPTHELGVRGLLSYFEREVCRWASAEQELRTLTERLRELPADEPAPTTPFAHVTLTDSPEDQLRAARANCLLLAKSATPLPALPPRSAAERAGRLRIGYVSCDFHQHATSILIAEMLEQHDRERFEVTLYSHGKSDGTAMRQRIERSSEHFVDVWGQPDAQVAQRIRDDGIDLLIDLKGHTKDNRLGIFAWRPARVQAHFLGFPGTTGANFVDYLIGDAVVTPFAHAPHYTEKIAHMPVCYQPNDRQRARPPVPSRAECGLPQDALVLCGFNQPFKLTPEVFDVWCRLLQRLPNAVLWLLEWNNQVAKNIAAEARARGIDPARIVWAPRRTPDLHMARHQQADLFIDTWPCNAHTSASDALWAGVPVVTYSGRTFASRVAASLNHAVGLDDLNCDSIEAYEGRVMQLAQNADLRRQLRQYLLQGRDSFILFDSLRFTRDIEALYGRMMARHDAGLPPEHLPAAG